MDKRTDREKAHDIAMVLTIETQQEIVTLLGGILVATSVHTFDTATDPETKDALDKLMGDALSRRQKNKKTVSARITEFSGLMAKVEEGDA